VQDAVAADDLVGVLEQDLHARTVVETAEVLGIPVGTVKSRSHYAMRVLRGMVPQGRGGLERVA
jgi:RNA polymerase sigma-70 factor (ECF subfamily)